MIDSQSITDDEEVEETLDVSIEPEGDSFAPWMSLITEEMQEDANEEEDVYDDSYRGQRSPSHESSRLLVDSKKFDQILQILVQQANTLDRRHGELDRLYEESRQALFQKDKQLRHLETQILTLQKELQEKISSLEKVMVELSVMRPNSKGRSVKESDTLTVSDHRRIVQRLKDSFNSRISTLEGEKGELVFRISQFRVELAQLKNQVEERLDNEEISDEQFLRLKSAIETSLVQLTSETSGLRHVLFNTQKDLASVQEELASSQSLLNKSEEDREHLKTLLAAMQEELRVLSTRLESSEAERQSAIEMSKDLSQKEEELFQLKLLMAATEERFAASRKTLDETTGLLDSTSQELDSSKLYAEDMRLDLRRKSEEIERLTQALGNLQNDLQTSSAVNEQQISEIERMKSEIKSLQENESSLAEQTLQTLDIYRNEMAAKEEKIASLEGNHECLLREHRRLEEGVLEKVRRVTELELLLQSEKQIAEKTVQKLQEFEKNIATLERERDSAWTDAEHHRAINKELSDRLDDLVNKYESTKQHLEKTEGELTKELKSNDRLRIDFRSLELRINSISSECDNLREALQETRSSLSLCQSVHSEQMADFTSFMAALEENARLKTLLSLSASNTVQDEIYLGQFREALDRKEEEEESSQSEVDRLTRLLLTLQSKQVQEDLSTATISKELSDARDALARANDRLSEANKKSASLEETNIKNLKHIKMLEGRISKLEEARMNVASVYGALPSPDRTHNPQLQVSTSSSPVASNVRTGSSSAEMRQPPRKRLRLSRSSTAPSETSLDSPKHGQMKQETNETNILTRASTETEVLGSSVSRAIDIDDSDELTSPSSTGDSTAETPKAKSGRGRGRPRASVVTDTKRKTRASTKLEAEESAQALSPTVGNPPKEGSHIAVKTFLDLLAWAATWKLPGKFPACAFCRLESAKRKRSVRDALTFNAHEQPELFFEHIEKAHIKFCGKWHGEEYVEELRGSLLCNGSLDFTKVSKDDLWNIYTGFAALFTFPLGGSFRCGLCELENEWDHGERPPLTFDSLQQPQLYIGHCRSEHPAFWKTEVHNSVELLPSEFLTQ